MDNIYWYWWALAFILLIIEMITVATFSLWLSIAAIILGAITWFYPELSIYYQITLFSLLALVILGVGFKFFIKKQKISKENTSVLNQRMAGYIGQVFILETAIENGRGKVRIGDSLWIAVGEDLAQGSQVKVIDIIGTTLKVQAHHIDI